MIYFRQVFCLPQSVDMDNQWIGGWSALELVNFLNCGVEQGITG
jgi:hypothetical protein